MKLISGQNPNLLFLNNFELDRFNVFEMKESLVALPDANSDRNKILKRVIFRLLLFNETNAWPAWL